VTLLRLDDKFTRHPKVAGLTDKAFRVHVETMVYCASYNTKGRIPPVALKLAGATKKQTNELLAAGLWDENGIGMVIHDFELYNGQTLEARVRAYLDKEPSASANDVCKVVMGNRQLVLEIVKRVRGEDGST
jgi:hypothetical protein